MTIKELTTKAKQAGLVQSDLDGRIVANKYRAMLADPGDLASDSALYMGIAIAEAALYPSRRHLSPGWIPRVQELGCKIAELAPAWH